MKKQSKTGKYVYFTAIALLVLVFGLFVLEKSQVTNFYNKPVAIVSTDPVLTDVIDYSPAAPTDNVDIDNQKVDEQKDATTEPDSTSPINVVLTAAGQDEVGGPVVIRALVTNVKGGTCTLLLTKDNVTKNYSANIINTGTYYSCEGFDIPINELSVGTWKIDLTVNYDGKTSKVEQTTEVSL